MVIGREVGVNQNRPIAARRHLGKDAGRNLQPFRQFRPGHAQRRYGIGEHVEIRHMPQGQRPGRNVGEVFRPTPTADLEGRHRRQQWQGGFGSAGNLLGHPVCLRLGDHTHALIWGDGGKEGMQRDVAVADGTADVVQGCAVIANDHL